MSAISYGSKYVKGLSTKAIAALVRADIKAALKTGGLPRGKYSVRTSYGTTTSSISVSISEVMFTDGETEETLDVFNPERLRADRDQPHVFCPTPWMSDAARDLTTTIERMVEAYNFDGSDSQSDCFHVNFYAHVDFDHDWQRARRAIELAKLADEDHERLNASERADLGMNAQERFVLDMIGGV